MRKRARWVPVGQIEYTACFKLEKSAGFTYPSGWLPANVKMASFVIDEAPGFGADPTVPKPHIYSGWITCFGIPARVATAGGSADRTK